MKPRKRFKTVEADDVPLTPLADVPTAKPGITKDFLLAGRAYFAVTNNKGLTFWYKVHRREFNSTSEGFFVRVAHKAEGAYEYVGVLNGDTGVLAVVGRSIYIQGTPEFEVAKWALSTVFAGHDIPEGYTICHIGKCGRCGRTLIGHSKTGLHTEEEDCP
jgi:hypothetical protein